MKNHGIRFLQGLAVLALVGALTAALPRADVEPEADSGPLVGTPSLSSYGAAGDDDVDGDGVPDLLDNCLTVANPDQVDSDVFVHGPPQIIALRNWPTSVDVMDVDGDGDQDVVAASGSDWVGWFRNLDGRGTFGPQITISTEPQIPRLLVVADIDGDDRTDFLVNATGTGNQRVFWFKNLGGGNFATGRIIANGTGSIFTVDVDSDGDTDVLLNTGWLENVDGIGTFTAREYPSAYFGERTEAVGGDLDGDGVSDLVVTSRSSDVVAWFPNVGGVGTFGPGLSIGGNLAYWAVAVGDLDADGDSDVVTAALWDENVSWFENTNAAGSFAGPRTVDATGLATQVDLLDLDNDGDPDILAGGYGLGWYENLDGGGTLGQRRPIEDDPGARSTAVADFNGDGVLDGLAAFSSDDKIVWYDGGDRIGDACDNCPGRANGSQADLDGDAVGDACDNCQALANADQSDLDGDGLGDACDNCPVDANLDQIDGDGDGLGDACDPCTDSDGDGFGDPGVGAGDCPVDNCPQHFNPDQFNTDGDAFGDVCDFCPLAAPNNPDSDGVCSNVDNCPDAPNASQFDGDGDGFGNSCDNCDDLASLDQTDSDADSFGDVCDNCPAIPNARQLDFDNDGVGDDCDPCTDADGDGFGESGGVFPASVCSPDNCPAIANANQTDTDEDGEGDLCDIDDGVVSLRLDGSIAWDAEIGFVSWNLYRGELAVLRAEGLYTQEPGTNASAHRRCGLPDTGILDGAGPPVDQAWFYLVTGVASGVESTLGLNSDGNLRVNAHPCP